MKFKTLMFKEPVNSEEVNFAILQPFNSETLFNNIPELFNEKVTLDYLSGLPFFRRVDFSKLELVEVELNLVVKGNNA